MHVTSVTLPLYQNLIAFEGVHGNQQQTEQSQLLDELLKSNPDHPELWLTCARMDGRMSSGWREAVERGVTQCPRPASELYCYAARME